MHGSARLHPTHYAFYPLLQVAKDEEYLAKNLMSNLPPLGERVQEIRQGKAATCTLDNERNFAISQVCCCA